MGDASAYEPITVNISEDENSWIPGIYCIRFPSGKFYVGSSNDVVERIKYHLSKMKNGKHRNLKMQREWDVYGEASSEVLLVCRVDDLIFFEQVCIDRFKPQLNISLVAGRNGWSEESRKKVSATKKGKPTGNVYSIETRQRMSFSMKGKNTKPRTPEWKKKISRTLQIRGENESRPLDVRAKIGKNSQKMWDNRSKEERAEISKKMWATRRARMDRSNV